MADIGLSSAGAFQNGAPYRGGGGASIDLGGAQGGRAEVRARLREVRRDGETIPAGRAFVRGSGGWPPGQRQNMESQMINPLALAAGAILLTTAAHAGGMTPAIDAASQDMRGGTVTAASVTAAVNGWLVVHRTDDAMKPGPVVGHAPLAAGENTQVVAILTEPVAPGGKLMLMVHAEAGGAATGIFEYSLGAAEDGPVRLDGALVMRVVEAR
jgi:hypothetical protein